MEWRSDMEKDVMQDVDLPPLLFLESLVSSQWGEKDHFILRGRPVEVHYTRKGRIMTYIDDNPPTQTIH